MEYMNGKRQKTWRNKVYLIYDDGMYLCSNKLIAGTLVTLFERSLVSRNSLFHALDGTGVTENPDATNNPIHSP